MRVIQVLQGTKEDIFGHEKYRLHLAAGRHRRRPPVPGIQSAERPDRGNGLKTIGRPDGARSKIAH